MDIKILIYKRGHLLSFFMRKREGVMREYITWATMIELPIFLTLFRLMFKNRKELGDDIDNVKNNSDQAMSSTKDALAEFKLHVARNYVSINYLKDVEGRITNHLLRIEKKLDEVGRGI